MNYPAAEQRGIRCHAGLDKPAPAIGKPGASSLNSGFRLLSAFGGFAGMTIRCMWAGYEKKNITFDPLTG